MKNTCTVMYTCSIAVGTHHVEPYVCHTCAIYQTILTYHRYLRIVAFVIAVGKNILHYVLAAMAVVITVLQINYLNDDRKSMAGETCTFMVHGHMY